MSERKTRRPRRHYPVHATPPCELVFLNVDFPSATLITYCEHDEHYYQRITQRILHTLKRQAREVN